MSILRPEIWVYWGPRREDARACAARLARMFEDLRAIHPDFARWYHKGYRPSEWNRPLCSIPPRLDELTAIFEKGKHYKDVPREPMPELGFSFSTWNGRNDDRAVVLRVQCRCLDEVEVFSK